MRIATAQTSFLRRHKSDGEKQSCLNSFVTKIERQLPDLYGNSALLPKQECEDWWRLEFRKWFRNPMIVDCSLHFLLDEPWPNFRAQTIETNIKFGLDEKTINEYLDLWLTVVRE